MVAQLHNHSHFSLRDGISRVSEMFVRVKELGQTAIALTDHGTLSGAIDFYRASYDTGVKPIIGVEAYMAATSLHSHTSQHDDVSSNNHLILLAMNNQGYRDLVKLMTIANTDGFYHKPRIDFETLSEYQSNLIALSGCMMGKVPQLIAADPYSMTDAKRYASRFKELFGDRYFIEMHDGGLRPQKALKGGLRRLAKELDIPLVASSDSHYLRPEDKATFQLMRAISWNREFDQYAVTQLGQTAEEIPNWEDWLSSPLAKSWFSREKRDTERSDEDQSDIHIKSTEEMLALFGQEAVENTQVVADRCNVSLDFSRVLLPDFPIPDGYTPHQYLQKQVYEGLQNRYGIVNDAHRQRADYELSIIENTKYSLYFLIVQDYVNFARSRGVMAVPRGSVAGSLCVYALGICDIDPMKYDIMFERFLNEERKGMPDIDLDFADDCRKDIIEYIRDKYGKGNVAHIGTFQTLGARASIKDVARVMNIDFVVSNALTSMFPDKPDTTLADVTRDEKLKDLIDSNETYSKVYKYACAIEGLNRSFGTHAAGILISGEPLEQIVPVSRPTRKIASDTDTGLYVTQFDNNNSTANVEALGLSKFDFLGLSNLSIIRDACAIIKERHGVDLYGKSGERLYSDLPTEYSHPMARKAFDMLSRGQTSGLFQTESAGMRQVLQSVRPTRLSDLPAVIALYRPGPLQNIPVFAEQKKSPDLVVYENDIMREILYETYGVITYQDQVLQIARRIAGFSWGEVDAFRKGMGKKLDSVIEAQKSAFISRSVARGHAQEWVEHLWTEIEPFAGYGFNKAHAYCYGYVSFITAFLKANYTIEYMTAAMMHDFKNKDKIEEYVDDCRRMNIDVLLPSANLSMENFSIISIADRLNPGMMKDAIIFGLTTIRGIGSEVAKNIVVNREKSGGKYFGLSDFIRRSGINNSKAISNMVFAGAFDSFGHREDIEKYLQTNIGSIREPKVKQRPHLKDHPSFFDGLEIDFGIVAEVIPEKDEPFISGLVMEKDRWSAETKTNRERLVLGVAISEGPETLLRRQLSAFGATLPADIPSVLDQEYREVIIGGRIVNIKTIIDKRGQEMAFITLQSIGGDIDVVIFAGSWRTFKPLGFLELGKDIFVHGMVHDQGRRISVMGGDFCPMDRYAPLPPVEASAVHYETTIDWDVSSLTPSVRIFRLWELFESSDELSSEYFPIRVKSSLGNTVMYANTGKSSNAFRIIGR